MPWEETSNKSLTIPAGEPYSIQVATVCPMSEQIRQSKNSVTETSPDVEEHDAASAVNAETLANDLDDLLDQIDEVLESDAEEFVKNYVQKGGE